MPKNARKGFALLILAVILAIGGIMLISLLSPTDKNSADFKNTSKKLPAIQKAIKVFQNIDPNNALPCPAPLNADPANAAFGSSGLAVLANNCRCSRAHPGTYCPGGGTSSVVIGGVPTRTLGLPDSYAFDEWGNRLTYVMTVPTDAAQAGATLNVKDLSGNTIPGIEALVISHGHDGIGAFPRHPYALPSTLPGCLLPGASTTQSELQNCSNYSDMIGAANWIIDKYNTTSANFFDDVTKSVHRCPGNVDGCAIWLDAADGSTINTGSPVTNDLVALWKDKSGNKNDFFQNNNSNQPSYKASSSYFASKPAVAFNQKMLTTSNNFSTPNFTAIIAYEAEPYVGGDSPYARLLDQVYYQSFWIGRNSTSANSWGGGFQSSGYIFAGLPDGQANLLTFKHIPGTNYPYGNGTSAGAAGTNNNPIPNTPITLGSWSLNEGVRGQIAEVAFYPTAISDPDRRKVECYLANKWNITPAKGGCNCPAGVLGCSLWLDGEDINGDNINDGTSIGEDDGIAEWVDKSGYLHNAQSGNLGSNPIYKSTAMNGNPALEFNGIDNYMKSVYAQPRPFTIFVIYNSLSGNNGRTLSGDYNSNPSYNWLLGSWQAHAYGHYTNAAWVGNQGYGSATTSNIMLMALDDSANSSFYQNGNFVASDSSSLGIWGPNLFLGQLSNGSEFGQFQISEVLAYPYILDAGEQKKIQCYLSVKWGITVTGCP